MLLLKDGLKPQANNCNACQLGNWVLNQSSELKRIIYLSNNASLCQVAPGEAAESASLSLLGQLHTEALQQPCRANARQHQLASLT